MNNRTQLVLLTTMTFVLAAVVIALQSQTVFDAHCTMGLKTEADTFRVTCLYDDKYRWENTITNTDADANVTLNGRPIEYASGVIMLGDSGIVCTIGRVWPTPVTITFAQPNYILAQVTVPHAQPCGGM